VYRMVLSCPPTCARVANPPPPRARRAGGHLRSLVLDSWRERRVMRAAGECAPCGVRAGDPSADPSWEGSPELAPSGELCRRALAPLSARRFLGRGGALKSLTRQPRRVHLVRGKGQDVSS
jgi:hypothetical protein